ncbi:MAG: hypothetical protein NC110_08175 [Ruminococcus sp.]|nr:hypothetical protein [Ruminococcus sp.]
MAKSNTSPAVEEQINTDNVQEGQVIETDPWKRKKPITIPRLAGSKEQPDIIASVNGRIFQIQRGKTVEVPEPVYEVLERSFKAETEAEIDYYSKAQTD